MRRLVVTVLGVLTFGVVTPSPARAQQDARELEAKKACLANKPDRGIELLAELYADTNDPTYIYNQGRCYQQNGRGPDALIRFREYLRKATALSPADKAEVERVVAELEEHQRKTEAEAAARAQAATQATGAQASGAAAAPAAAPTGKRELRIAGLATASVGVVGIGLGVYMGMRAQQLSTEVTNDARNMKFSQAKYDEGQRAELMQWIGYGVGGLALVTGGVLYVVGMGRFGGEPSAVAFAPTFRPDGGGASVRLTF